MSRPVEDHTAAAPAGVSADSPGGESASTVCVCGHPLDEHDSISARYCEATIAGGLERGCVCSAVPGKYPGRM